MKILDSSKLLNSLSEGGKLASKLDYFEPRQTQLELMELIIQCFNENSIGAAEAGTGVGKSFAYLIPAIYFASQTKERVIVSTATITLQRQLFDKDIPLVLDALKLKIKAVLVKGRGNYLCFRRLEEALMETALIKEENEDFLKIKKWAETSTTGEKDDMDFSPSDNIWSKVCSDSDLCMGRHCPLYGHCFITILRRNAAAAKLIVVNHHLLFADLAARKEGAGYEATAVLPPYSRIIIDEAHTIEKTATSFFSKEFSRLGILRLIGRLHRKRKGGLLDRFCSMLPSSDKSLDEMTYSLDSIREAASELDRPALELCDAENVFRFSPEKDNYGAGRAIFPLLLALKKKLYAFNEKAYALIKMRPQEDIENPVIWEIKSILKRFESIALICESFIDFKNRQEDVLWIEKTGKGTPRAVFTQSPVDISKSLKEGLFEPNKTIICVSATLSINGNFNYWAVRCGAALAADKQLLSGCFPSPFPYSSSVLLACPSDAPFPDEEGYEGFLSQSVRQLVSASGGSALVLFTSYYLLEKTWNSVKPDLEALGIKCLKQGDDDRSKLLRSFIEDKSSCLFATDSFWEGIDAPGDTLRLVVLCRLPFRIPSDPVFEARCEAVEREGGKSFMNISLPEAVIKFRQGFGRLIRRSRDRGAVAVMDSRLIKKYYGSYFLQSIPETLTSFSDFSGILCDVENFLLA